MPLLSVCCQISSQDLVSRESEEVKWRKMNKVDGPMIYWLVVIMVTQIECINTEILLYMILFLVIYLRNIIALKSHMVGETIANGCILTY